MRPNTVGEIVNALIEEGLVEEVGALAGHRGRRRRLLELSSRSAVLGAELFEGAVRVGVISLRGELLGFAEHELPSRRRRRVIEALIRFLRPMASGRDVRGLGVGVAGVVDSEHGVSRRAAGFEDWEDVPLAAELEGALRVPVRLGNLTEVRLVGLKHAGLIAPGMTAALVVLEPGAIGCGIVAEGQILRGAVEASSELGHTKLASDGPLCHCGARGCLEVLTAWPHLCKEIRRRGGKSPRDLAAFFASAEPEVADVREQLIERVGLALANLALLVKPSHLWLTGTLTIAREQFVEPLIAVIRRHVLPPFAEALRMEVLEHGPEDGVRGAAGLILDRLFAMPEIRYF
jgi:predicted NBD/HSP70 family sugar kinase